MSYVNKKSRIFNEANGGSLYSIRSEGRMKDYFSNLDIRAWSDIIEERRQHFLEYQAKNREGHCLEKLIPLEIVFDSILAQKNYRIQKLLKKIRYFRRILAICQELELPLEENNYLYIREQQLPDGTYQQGPTQKRESRRKKSVPDDPPDPNITSTAERAIKIGPKAEISVKPQKQTPRMENDEKLEITKGDDRVKRSKNLGDEVGGENIAGKDTTRKVQRVGTKTEWDNRKKPGEDLKKIGKTSEKSYKLKHDDLKKESTDIFNDEDATYHGQPLKSNKSDTTDQPSETKKSSDDIRKKRTVKLASVKTKTTEKEPLLEKKDKIRKAPSEFTSAKYKEEERIKDPIKAERKSVQKRGVSESDERPSYLRTKHLANPMKPVRLPKSALFIDDEAPKKLQKDMAQTIKRYDQKIARGRKKEEEENDKLSEFKNSEKKKEIERPQPMKKQRKDGIPEKQFLSNDESKEIKLPGSPSKGSPKYVPKKEGNDKSKVPADHKGKRSLDSSFIGEDEGISRENSRIVHDRFPEEKIRTKKKRHIDGKERIKSEKPAQPPDLVVPSSSIKITSDRKIQEMYNMEDGRVAVPYEQVVSDEKRKSKQPKQKRATLPTDKMEKGNKKSRPGQYGVKDGRLAVAEEQVSDQNEKRRLPKQKRDLFPTTEFEKETDLTERKKYEVEDGRVTGSDEQVVSNEKGKRKKPKQTRALFAAKEKGNDFEKYEEEDGRLIIADEQVISGAEGESKKPEQLPLKRLGNEKELARLEKYEVEDGSVSDRDVVSGKKRKSNEPKHRKVPFPRNEIKKDLTRHEQYEVQDGKDIVDDEKQVYHDKSEVPKQKIYLFPRKKLEKEEDLTGGEIYEVEVGRVAARGGQVYSEEKGESKEPKQKRPQFPTKEIGKDQDFTEHEKYELEDGRFGVPDEKGKSKKPKQKRDLLSTKELEKEKKLSGREKYDVEDGKGKEPKQKRDLFSTTEIEKDKDLSGLEKYEVEDGTVTVTDVQVVSYDKEKSKEPRQKKDSLPPEEKDLDGPKKYEVEDERVGVTDKQFVSDEKRRSTEPKQKRDLFPKKELEQEKILIGTENYEVADGRVAEADAHAKEKIKVPKQKRAQFPTKELVKEKDSTGPEKYEEENGRVTVTDEQVVSVGKGRSKEPETPFPAKKLGKEEDLAGPEKYEVEDGRVIITDEHVVSDEKGKSKGPKQKRDSFLTKELVKEKDLTGRGKYEVEAGKVTVTEEQVASDEKGESKEPKQKRDPFLSKELGKENDLNRREKYEMEDGSDTISDEHIVFVGKGKSKEPPQRRDLFPIKGLGKKKDWIGREKYEVEAETVADEQGKSKEPKQRRDLFPTKEVEKGKVLAQREKHEMEDGRVAEPDEHVLDGKGKIKEPKLERGPYPIKQLGKEKDLIAREMYEVKEESVAVSDEQIVSDKNIKTKEPKQKKALLPAKQIKKPTDLVRPEKFEVKDGRVEDVNEQVLSRPVGVSKVTDQKETLFPSKQPGKDEELAGLEKYEVEDGGVGVPDEQVVSDTKKIITSGEKLSDHNGKSETIMELEEKQFMRLTISADEDTKVDFIDMKQPFGLKTEESSSKISKPVVFDGISKMGLSKPALIIKKLFEEQDISPEKQLHLKTEDIALDEYMKDKHREKHVEVVDEGPDIEITQVPITKEAKIHSCQAKCAKITIPFPKCELQQQLEEIVSGSDPAKKIKEAIKGFDYYTKGEYPEFEKLIIARKSSTVEGPEGLEYLPPSISIMKVCKAQCSKTNPLLLKSVLPQRQLPVTTETNMVHSDREIEAVLPFSADYKKLSSVKTTADFDDSTKKKYDVRINKRFFTEPSQKPMESVQKSNIPKILECNAPCAKQIPSFPKPPMTHIHSKRKGVKDEFELNNRVHDSTKKVNDENIFKNNADLLYEPQSLELPIIENLTQPKLLDIHSCMAPCAKNNQLVPRFAILQTELEENKGADKMYLNEKIKAAMLAETKCNEPYSKEKTIIVEDYVKEKYEIVISNKYEPIEKKTLITFSNSEISSTPICKAKCARKDNLDGLTTKVSKCNQSTFNSTGKEGSILKSCIGNCAIKTAQKTNGENLDIANEHENKFLENRSSPGSLNQTKLFSSFFYSVEKYEDNNFFNRKETKRQKISNCFRSQENAKKNTDVQEAQNPKQVITKKHQSMFPTLKNANKEENEDFSSELKKLNTRQDPIVHVKMQLPSFTSNLQTLISPIILDTDYQIPSNDTVSPRSFLIYKKNIGTDVRDIFKIVSCTSLEQDITRGNRLFRVLAGDSTGLSDIQSFSLMFLDDHGYKTLSAQIFYKLFSDQKDNSKLFQANAIAETAKQFETKIQREVGNNMLSGKISLTDNLANKYNSGITNLISDVSFVGNERKYEKNKGKRYETVSVSAYKLEENLQKNIPRGMNVNKKFVTGITAESLDSELTSLYSNKPSQPEEIFMQVHNLNRQIEIEDVGNLLKKVSLTFTHSVRVNSSDQYYNDLFTPRGAFTESFRFTSSEIVQAIIRKNAIISGQNYRVYSFDDKCIPRIDEVFVDTLMTLDVGSGVNIEHSSKRTHGSPTLPIIPLDGFMKFHNSVEMTRNNLMVGYSAEVDGISSSTLRDTLWKIVENKNVGAPDSFSEDKIVFHVAQTKIQYHIVNHKDEEMLYEENRNANYISIGNSNEDQFSINTAGMKYSSLYPTTDNPEYHVEAIHKSNSTIFLKQLLIENQQLYEEASSVVRTKSLKAFIVHKDAEIFALRKALGAKESFGIEQQKLAVAAIQKLNSIKTIIEERDELKTKLESAQLELIKLKMTEKSEDPSQNSSSNSHSKGYQNDWFVKPNSEGKLSRECSVPRNEFSPVHRSINKKQTESGEVLEMKSNYIIKDLSNNLSRSIKEKKKLNNDLFQKESITQRYSEFPNKDWHFSEQSYILIKNTMHEKDLLLEKIEEYEKELCYLKKNSERINELEVRLECLFNEKYLKEEELKKTRMMLSSAEIESINQKVQAESLRSKITSLEEEMKQFKYLYTEQEKLSNKNKRLLKTLKELNSLKEDYQKLKNQMRRLDVLREERNIFKFKYENLKELESECDILRSQVARVNMIECERNILQEQVAELEACILEQENEIYRLLCHIDHLVIER